MHKKEKAFTYYYEITEILPAPTVRPFFASERTTAEDPTKRRERTHSADTTMGKHIAIGAELFDTMHLGSDTVKC